MTQLMHAAQVDIEAGSDEEPQDNEEVYVIIRARYCKDGRFCTVDGDDRMICAPFWKDGDWNESVEILGWFRPDEIGP